MLADGHDQGIRRQGELASRDGDWPPAAIRPRFPELVLYKLHPHHPAVLTQHPHRGGQLQQLHPLLQGPGKLLLGGGHLSPGAAIGNGHLPAQAPCHPSGVHGRVPSPDDHHLLAEVRPGPRPHPLQKLKGGPHTGSLDPLDGKRHLPPEATGDEHRIVAALEELFGGGNRLGEPEVHPQGEDPLHVPLYHLVREPERRDQAHHAPGGVLRLVDGDFNPT